MAEVRKAYNQPASSQRDRRVGRAVKEAMTRIHQALVLNPEFSPFGSHCKENRKECGRDG
jgi:hypothetical protein